MPACSLTPLAIRCRRGSAMSCVFFLLPGLLKELGGTQHPVMKIAPRDSKACLRIMGMNTAGTEG